MQSLSKLAGKYHNILVIGDLHCPSHHRDSFEFLKALKWDYDPDLIVNIGDEVDWNSLSYHEKDPSLPSPAEELRLARKYMGELYDLFPEMHTIYSNHGNLTHRKMQTTGMPIEMLRDKNEIYQVGEGWTHSRELIVKDALGEEIFFTHGIAKNILQVVQKYGMNVVQGHFHSEMGVKYTGIPGRTYWGAQTGCLIDWEKRAFNYNRLNMAKPMLGSCVICDTVPVPIPMTLTKSGRWNKRV